MFFGLVPAAILHSNPGITFDEFCRKLRYTGPFRLHPHNWPFGDSSMPDAKSVEYAGPIYIARDIFGLNHSEKLFTPDKKDIVRIERLNIKPRLGKHCWRNPQYTLTTYQGATEEGPLIIKTNCPFLQKIHPGEECSFISHHKPFRVNINGEKTELNTSQTRTFRLIKAKKRRSPQPGPVFYDIEAIELFQNYQLLTFDTLEDLVRAHPEYDPKTAFDHTQTYGKLYVGEPLDGFLRWFKIGQGYYLDEKQFLKSKLLDRDAHFIYDSLILTEQAMKFKAWQMLGFRCGDSYESDEIEFLLKHPSVVERRLKEAEAFWAFNYAKRKKLTNNQWLRERLLSPKTIQGSAVSFERKRLEKRAHQLLQQREEAIKRRRETQQHEEPNDEIPF